MSTSHKKARSGFAISSLLVLLLMATSYVHANDDRDRGFGRHQDRGFERGYERSEWRLGNHNQILMKTDRGWRRMPGSAIDVGDGWVIGTDRRAGGFGIYRWNGRHFERMPGGAVQIGGSYHSPWVINNRGEHFEWTGRDWREVRGYGSIWKPSRDSRQTRRGEW